MLLIQAEVNNFLLIDCSIIVQSLHVYYALLLSSNHSKAGNLECINVFVSSDLQTTLIYIQRKNVPILVGCLSSKSSSYDAVASSAEIHSLTDPWCRQWCTLLSLLAHLVLLCFMHQDSILNLFWNNYVCVCDLCAWPQIFAAIELCDFIKSQFVMWNKSSFNSFNSVQLSHITGIKIGILHAFFSYWSLVSFHLDEWLSGCPWTW